MEIADIRRARLRLWFANRTLPQEEKSYLSQLMSTKGKASFGERAARRLERDYGMEPLYLDRPIEESVESESVREPTDEEFSLVPQLDVSAACGDGKFVDHVVVKGGLAFKRSSLRDFGVPEKSARIIYASGGSMSPNIQDGCVVLLNLADREPRDGKVYAICTPDGGLVLKRLVFDYHPTIGAHVWIMRSDNPDKTAHPDKILPPDDRTAIIGRAVWNDNRL
ncbi:S24 family peptidase [Burkholderia sp. HI2500]|uniref:S24 family peptidase n=1 Tax=Burkholderia sp. HI2500 TaxID=2015358 RepID=UPI00117E63A2|nr:S24/S26 family peptidase [Burkholderia sp. HI2500]